MDLSQFASSELLLIIIGAIIIYIVLRALFKAGIFILLVLVAGALLLGYSMDGWVEKGRDITEKGFNSACEDGALSAAQKRSLTQERAQIRQELKTIKRVQNPKYYDRLTARVTIINSKLAQSKTCEELGAQ